MLLGLDQLTSAKSKANLQFRFDCKSNNNWDGHKLTLMCSRFYMNYKKIRITSGNPYARDPDWIQTNDLLLRRQLLKWCIRVDINEL